MPKRNLIKIRLPQEKPDSCWDCPLCGIIPPEVKKKTQAAYSKLSHVCLGTYKAMSGRGIKVKASEKDGSHRLRRPCDDRWHAWMLLPNRELGINAQNYLHCRIPFEQSLELRINYDWRGRPRDVKGLEDGSLLDMSDDLPDYDDIEE